MMFESKLEISNDLRVVKYDGRLYDVADVVDITYATDGILTTTGNFKDGGLGYYHKCNDNRCYTLVLDWVFDIHNKSYHVTFCNKCKKLFIKLVY